jgi:hypothetical protein
MSRDPCASNEEDTDVWRAANQPTYALSLGLEHPRSQEEHDCIDKLHQYSNWRGSIITQSMAQTCAEAVEIIQGLRVELAAHRIERAAVRASLGRALTRIQEVPDETL